VQRFAERLSDIGEADILIGITSFNSANTIGNVVRAVKAGVAEHFPGGRAVLINPDSGSADGTPEVAKKVFMEGGNTLIMAGGNDILPGTGSPYPTEPGKGRAFMAVFEAARRLNAKASAVLDADLMSITPEWIDLLLRPVLAEQQDLVVPYYLRHKFDGTITKCIVYPLTRALYGRRVMQPMGEDFGFSGSFLRFCLEKDAWDRDVAPSGMGIWLTTTALANGFRVCQSFVGTRKYDRKASPTDLSRVLSQAVSSVFMLMEEYEGVWKGAGGSTPVPVCGVRHEVGVEPVQVNIERMVNFFRLGLRELGPLWKKILSQESLTGLLEASKRVPFDIEDGLWAEVIYDFAVAWHKKVMSREHILKTLTPLYLGKVASLFRNMAESTAEEAEERLEALCQAFEGLKPYLMERWS
jgi:glycosyltransferase involved in cell wall biosynthesis